MVKNNRAKVIVDIVMIAILPALMAYQLVGEALHEWFGVAMLAAIIIHNALNWKWYRNLFKGKYTGVRILQTMVNFLMLAAIVCVMVSGISMSRYLFATLPFGIRASLACILHLLASYWSFALMSVHLGLHWSMVLGVLNKKIGMLSLRSTAIVLRIVSLIIAFFGAYAFSRREMGNYMFLRSEFVFYNFDEPVIFFFIDYIAVMGLLAIAAHYLSQVLKKHGVYAKQKESK